MNLKFRMIMTIAVLTVFSFSAFAQQYSYDYKNMKMDEYRVELGKWQKREADAKAGIAEEEGQIAQLQQDMSATQGEIDDCWNQIYTMLGTDKAGYDAFVGQCKALESDVNGLLALSPEDIYMKKNELEGYKGRLADLRKDKRSLGPDPYRILQRVESLINEAEKKGAPPAVEKYTVLRGDYLWRIAKKPAIYNDPYAWMRIYTANRGQISNPNLIYPQQIFDIPRVARRGEYWVNRGDNLAGIAKSAGNMFSWQKIYEANKDVIGADPNLIYPHTILAMPGM